MPRGISEFDTTFIQSRVDFDAQSYIQRVERASNGAMHPVAKLAINQFVVETKRFDLWSKINTCCILMGARTVTGALIPLKGTAPSGQGTLSTLYAINNQPGIYFNANTANYIITNRNVNADAQNDHHVAVIVGGMDNNAYIGGDNSTTAGSKFIGASAGSLTWRSTPSTSVSVTSGVTGTTPQFLGLSRSNSANFDVYRNGALANLVSTSGAQDANPFYVGANNNNSARTSPTAAQISFYSLGAALDLVSYAHICEDLYAMIAGIK